MTATETDAVPALTVAFVGLGNMGTPMARRLIDAGFAVRGADPSAAARDALVRNGGVAAADAVQAAEGSDVVILMLPNSGVVDQVVADVVAANAAGPGTTIIDMSSSEPDRTRHNAEELARSGIRYIDAPVSGGVSGAVAGTLTVMAGGSDEDVAHVRPVLDRLGRVRHVGPVGAGHAAKALNNLISATHLWLTSEAVVLAEQYGIERQTMLDVLNGSSGRSGSSEAKWPKFILTGTYDSGFGARLMLKDIGIANRLAQASGLPSDVGESLERAWSAATDDLSADADHTEVAAWLSARAEGTS